MPPASPGAACYNGAMENQKNTQKSDLWLWIGLGGGCLVLTCVLVLGVAVVAAGVIGYGWMANSPGSQAAPLPGIASPAPAATAFARPPADNPTAVPLPENAEETLRQLAEAEVPPRDRYELAIRFRGVDPNVPREIPIRPYAVGDVEDFTINNDDLGENLTAAAELVYISGNVYAWVEQGEDYDQRALEGAVDTFALDILPLTLQYFGGSAYPAPGENPQIHIMHSPQIGSGVAGYYFSPSEYPRAVVPTSNEKSMFFINLSNTPPTSPDYLATLAHELQHLIHWNVDQNEESWVNEGLSELSAQLNGFGQSVFTSDFTTNPGTQLNTWPEDGSTFEHYGAGYLFAAYFLEQFGDEATQALIASPYNGMEGVDEALDSIGSSLSASDVFANWVVANYLDDPRLQDSSGQNGLYGYVDIDYPQPPAELLDASGQSSSAASVTQYGTNYLALTGSGPVVIEFDGADGVGLAPVSTANTDGDDATDDSFAWWSNRSDDSDTTLTRAFDLTGASGTVFLEYDVWFSIEELWDYGYVCVSEDDGLTWQIMATGYTTGADPNGNSYGHGYSGSSSLFPNANEQGWLHEQVDLSAYAGKNILLRFEYVTDDAVTTPGMFIDNVRIDAISFYDDMESGDNGWETRGFIRHNNAIPQEFVVQLITLNRDGTLSVERMALDDANRGVFNLTLDDQSETILAISGLTRHTTELALYTLTVAGSR
ncbi:MAG: immune inhibitor A [Anaerolineae bacterium]|nr:immune inhibitor A [Anaerolineae bacterium]